MCGQEMWWGDVGGCCRRIQSWFVFLCGELPSVPLCRRSGLVVCICRCVGGLLLSTQHMISSATKTCKRHTSGSCVCRHTAHSSMACRQTAPMQQQAHAPDPPHAQPCAAAGPQEITTASCESPTATEARLALHNTHCRACGCCYCCCCCGRRCRLRLPIHPNHRLPTVHLAPAVHLVQLLFQFALGLTADMTAVQGSSTGQQSRAAKQGSST